MKLFAVILASIAALAATAQTYFIWSGAGGAAGAWGRQITGNQKWFACQQLLNASASLKRAAKQADDIIGAGAVQYLEDLRQYDPERANSEEAESEAAKRGRRAYLRVVISELGLINNFVDSEYIYFSEEERDGLGYDAWRAFFDEYGLLTSYVTAYELHLYDEEAFGGVRDAVEAIGDRHDSIKGTCAPILLSET